MPFIAPTCRPERVDDHVDLLEGYRRVYPSILAFPRSGREQIAAQKLARLVEIVEGAFAHVPFYREKYGAAGFRPGDLRAYEDFEKLPIVTKDELIEVWRDDGSQNSAITPGASLEFQTRSSGTSGRFLTVAQDRAMVMTDTLMGARQLDMQSGGTSQPSDVLVEIYTCEWWFSSIGGLHRRVFVPSRATVADMLATLRCLRPAFVSTYPSVLRNLLSSGARLSELGVRLAIVHSEQSRRAERDELSARAGVPVLDEYSSEELTRIALECPHRRYHLEEDAVHVEVVDMASGRTLAPGVRGEVVGTSLLNRAMPLVRYRQGDFATLSGSEACACGSSFRMLEAIEGRVMDSFPTPCGRVLTSGELMDAAYAWRLDLGIPVHGLEYRIVQHAIDRVEVRIRPGEGFEAEMTEWVRRQLGSLLGAGVSVEVRLVDAFPDPSGPKARLIESRVGERRP